LGTDHVTSPMPTANWISSNREESEQCETDADVGGTFAGTQMPKMTPINDVSSRPFSIAVVGSDCGRRFSEETKN
jgi:hypothetical protein